MLTEPKILVPNKELRRNEIPLKITICKQPGSCIRKPPRVIYYKRSRWKFLTNTCFRAIRVISFSLSFASWALIKQVDSLMDFVL